MFLSKRSSGIYYLWFTDDSGRKQKVSTGSRLKSDALKFLQRFRQDEHEKLVKLRQTPLSQFIDDFLRHSEVVHRPNGGILQDGFEEFPESGRESAGTAHHDP
jgi:hypothetical protein